jgi:hypothetical protein
MKHYIKQNTFRLLRVKACGRTNRCVIHKVIISICNKEELPEEWKE